MQKKYAELMFSEDHPMIKTYFGEILFNSKLPKVDIKFNAKGSMLFKDGRFYRGQFDKGNQAGLGVCYFPDTDEKMLRYEGAISNWLFDGKGKLYYKNGDFYEGEFKNNKPGGVGVYNYGENCEKLEEADWLKYSGDLNKGLYEGKGIITFKDGTLKSGNFIAGSLKSWD